MSVSAAEKKLNLDLLSDKGKEQLFLFYEYLLYKYHITKGIEQELKNDAGRNDTQDNPDIACS